MSKTVTTNLDELIEAERKRAAARITKLKRAAAAEQHRVDERVLVLLREQDPDLYERLAREAADALAVEKAKRSSRAKAAATPSPDEPAESPSHEGRQNFEEAASWNG